MHGLSLCAAGPLSSPPWNEATVRMDNMEYKDEWQDDDFPRWVSDDFDNAVLYRVPITVCQVL